MTPTTPEAEQFPPDFSPGDRAILAALQGWQERALELQEAKHAENAAHVENLEREFRAMASAVKTAFPDGDFDGHRRWHHAVMRKEEAKARFWEKIAAEVVSKGLWAALIFLGASAWLYVRGKIEGK